MDQIIRKTGSPLESRLPDGNGGYNVNRYQMTYSIVRDVETGDERFVIEAAHEWGREDFTLTFSSGEAAIIRQRLWISETRCEKPAKGTIGIAGSVSWDVSPRAGEILDVGPHVAHILSILESLSKVIV